MAEFCGFLVVSGYIRFVVSCWLEFVKRLRFSKAAATCALVAGAVLLVKPGISPVDDCPR